MDLPTTPPQQPATPASSASRGVGKRTLVALWLMIGPTALIIATLMLYAVVNFLFGATLGDEQGPLRATLNVILFLVGSLSVAAWLPGMIAGIILLSTRKK